MFHFFEAIQNTKGDALIGYYVKAVDRDTGDVIDIYADNNATPIVSVSAVDNACLVDSDGDASFYVTAGTYHVDIYATDAVTFIRRVNDWPMTLDIDATLSGTNTGDQFTDTTEGVLLGRGEGSGDGGAEEITLSGLTMTGNVLSVSGGAGGALVAANNLSDVASPGTSRTNLSVYSQAEVDAAIATVQALSGGVLNGFVSGGQAIWVSGFQYTVTAASYYIGGVLYTSAEQSITLSAADATFDRIDVLALDNTGTLVKITGTAATAPSEPDIDASTQIEVTFVTVGVSATAPATATTESVYLEDAQWTSSITSGTHINKASTSNPRTGTKCIEATSAVTNDVLLLNKGSTILASSYTNLVFYLRNKTANWSTTRLRFHFRNSSGARVGAIVPVGDGTFGFSTANTSSYQAVSIPMTAFAVPAGTSIQSLNVAVNGTTAIGWYMDDVILQLNGAGTGSGSGLTQTQADARYAQRSANGSDFASAVAAKDNLSPKGANIASASTTNLATATGDFVDVTGTTTITAFGTATAGVERVVRFNGALTLTHNATSLILPGGASITTASGDVARFRSLGSGNWVCVGYMKASGAAVVAPSNGGTPTVVASNTQSSSNSSYTVSWPTGTAAGDWVFIFAAHAFAINAVSGWQSFDNQNGSNFNGACFAKKMTAGDISTGSVAVTATSSSNGVIQSITIRNLTGIRDYNFVRDATGWASYPIGLPMADSTDLILVFAATRATSTNTFSPSMTIEQTQNATAASAALGSSSSLGLTELGASTTISFPGTVALGAYVAALALC